MEILGYFYPNNLLFASKCLEIQSR